MTLKPSARQKLPASETQARKANRLRAIRLRTAIYRELDKRGTATPAEIGAALELPTAETATLLSRKHFRDGDLAQLEAAAVRLGIVLPTS
jgi:hypothetical protein